MTSRTRVAKHRKRQDLRCEELDLGYLGKLWLPKEMHEMARAEADKWDFWLTSAQMQQTEKRK
jgi:hypothetical protein